MIKPATPKIPSSVFFTIITALPAVVFFVFKNTHVSINAGKASPSDDRQRAPNSDINKSNFGIATAKITIETKSYLENEIN